jgi:hypothetical protein
MCAVRRGSLQAPQHNTDAHVTSWQIGPLGGAKAADILTDAIPLRTSAREAGATSWSSMRAGGIARSIAARCRVPLCDFIDCEHRSCPDCVPQRQQNGQRDQSIEPRSESFVLHEVKRCQHPHIDVRKAIRREYDIADDGQYLQSHAPAGFCKILQGAANNCVPEKRKKPPVEGLYGSGDDPFFRKWMENTRKVGLNSRTQAFGGTDRGHVSSLPSHRTPAACSATFVFRWGE